MGTSMASAPRPRRADAVVIALICIVAALTLFWITTSFRHEIIQMSIGGRWFQSDGWRVYDDMTSFNANHYRTTLRPLFSLLSIPFTSLLGALFNTSPIESIWLLSGIYLSAWCSGIYLTCRLIGASLVSSCLLVLLALSSAATLFWFTVPETYGLSSLVLVFTLMLVAFHIRRPVDNWVWIVVGTLLAGTLITNFSIIVLLSFFLKPRKDAIYISVVCLILFFSGWAVQKIVFPKPAAIPFYALEGEKQFLLHKDQGGVLCKLAGEIIHPIIAPHIRPSDDVEPTGKRLTVQCATIEQSGLPYGIAIAGWLALLVWGIRSMAKYEFTKKFLLSIFLMLGTQVALHLLYGEETFLYALHFSPFLVVLSAGIFIGHRKLFVTWLLAGFVTFVAINNMTRLEAALSYGGGGNTDIRILKRFPAEWE